MASDADIVKIGGDIDGLWHELNVLRLVVAYLISLEVNKNEDADAALRTIAEQLHAQFDDRTVPDSKRSSMEAARLAIDDLVGMARAIAGLGEG
jgi:hypothetical protein